VADLSCGEPDQVAEPQARPAYYAAGPGPLRDWWTLLHPPFTAWHLSYVVLGAMLAPHARLDRLVAALIAFFLAVGLSAHALDELHGRPLRTSIPAPALVAVTAAGYDYRPDARDRLQRRAVRRADPHRPGLRRGVGGVPSADRLRRTDGKA